MNTWTVLVQHEALEELDRLPKDIQARFQRLFDLVEEMGQTALTMPHARHIQGHYGSCGPRAVTALRGASMS